MPGPPLVLVSGKDVTRAAGGHESYVRAHALAATRLGFEPHVFCVGRRRGVVATPHGTVHVVAPELPVAAQVPQLAAAVTRFVRGRRDTAGIHGFALWSAAGVLAARRLGRAGIDVPALASAYGTRRYEVTAMQDGLAGHGPAHQVRYRAWCAWVAAVDDPLERRGYTGARLVLVNYASVARILDRACGPGLPLRQVAYAAEDAFAADAAVPGARSAPPLIVAVSRHDPRKGVDVLLRALAELAGSGVAFRARLLGEGRLLGDHRRLASSLGLADRVALPGRVVDVHAHLAEAELFVLPSLAEASGSVSVLEALRARVAVVASACDGVPEDLEHGHDALLVKPGDPSALAAALRRLLEDPALRGRLAVAGRATYERRFTADQLVAALAGAYAEAGIIGSPFRVRSSRTTRNSSS